MKSRFARRVSIALAFAVFLLLLYEAIIYGWARYLLIWFGLSVITMIGWIVFRRDHRRYR